jgi:hypothetical protein
MNDNSKRDKKYGKMNKARGSKKGRGEDWDRGFREREHREKRNSNSQGQVRPNDYSHMESDS